MLQRAFVRLLPAALLSTIRRHPVRGTPPASKPLAVLALALLALLLGACAPSMVMGTVGRAETTAVSPVAVTGVASWYGPKFAGRRTANGEIFDPSQLTAAHRTLPFGTLVRVTNLATGANVVVRINDRGPFKDNRIIDLSRASADAIGLTARGVGTVRLEPLTLPAGALRLAVGSTLQGYQVESRLHPVGQLLLLRPGAGGDGVIVRVIGSSVPSESGADLLVAGAVFDELGGVADVSTD